MPKHQLDLDLEEFLSQVDHDEVEEPRGLEVGQKERAWSEWDRTTKGMVPTWFPQNHPRTLRRLSQEQRNYKPISALCRRPQ